MEAKPRDLRTVLNRIIQEIPEEGVNLSDNLKLILSKLGFKAPEMIQFVWIEAQNEIFSTFPKIDRAPGWYIRVLEIWSGKK